MKQAFVTAALVALFVLAGWALYATGWTDGYAEAVLDYENAGIEPAEVNL